ncbi:hypothetical protein PFISCL1PPCAC_15735 [Pristionchus fissidentatus]|uniref:DUF7778 domain-containing protein n=1 Tax=Pristionchus fissidentatus TaxID=1538716 RepID=A0AAV5VYG6_9BILA|nr:hypothetical protein PFISCL1PPCAC_15735 [Pristionchus fissidentatus]
MTSVVPLLNEFIVAKDFLKMHTMPDHRVYAVKQEDTVVEGSISCYTRHKGFFRDVVTAQSMRHLVLTKTGYLLLWMTPTKGFTLRLAKVTDVATETTALKYRTGFQRRCSVKIHFSFGTLNVILANGQIDKWRNALIIGCDKKPAAPVPTPRNVLVETATNLFLVPPFPLRLPLPQKGFISASVVYHRPSIRPIDSIDEWRSSWTDVDTITPPSHNVDDCPFPRYRSIHFNLPQQKVFHITKNTVPPTLRGGIDASPAVLPSPVDLPSDIVVLPEKSPKSVRSKRIVKRSHTVVVEMPAVGLMMPIDKRTSSDNSMTGRRPAVDRWLRSQIEKRARPTSLSETESEFDDIVVPIARHRSASAGVDSCRPSRRVR